MPVVRLHFVYNVEATPLALVTDFVHRIVDPASYPCRLCDLTYGRFIKNPGWQMFVWSLPVKSLFYTRDGFVRAYPWLAETRLPVVLAEDDRGRITTLISARDFDQLASLEALKSEVHTRLVRANAKQRRRKRTKRGSTGGSAATTRKRQSGAARTRGAKRSARPRGR